MSKEEYSSPTMSQGANTLAQGTVIKGNVTSQTDFKVEGMVEGKIECQGRVTIGPNGKVIGDIICANADIYGNVGGNLKISDTLSLRSSANVKGDVSTKVLVIEPNAFFCGSCDMKGGAVSSASSSTSSSSNVVSLED